MTKLCGAAKTQIQPPGTRVCLVIPYKVAFEGHD